MFCHRRRARAASRMQLRVLPFAAANAVAGRGFLAALPSTVRGRTRRARYDAGDSSSPSLSSEKEKAKEKVGEQVEAKKRREAGPTEDALRRLAELDAQLEGLSEQQVRPPAPPPPPEPYLDRDMITARGRSTDELPEMTPSYVAFSTLALFILTIFTNVMFNLYIKPSVDGVDKPVRIQRVALGDPGIQQTTNSGSS